MDNLTPKNQKIINERFGSLEDAVIWFNGCEEDVLSTILNNLIDGFEPKPNLMQKLKSFFTWNFKAKTN